MWVCAARTNDSAREFHPSRARKKERRVRETNNGISSKLSIIGGMVDDIINSRSHNNAACERKDEDEP